MRTLFDIALVEPEPRERFQGEKAAVAAEIVFGSMERGKEGGGRVECEVGFVGVESGGGEVAED